MHDGVFHRLDRRCNNDGGLFVFVPVVLSVSAVFVPVVRSGDDVKQVSRE